MQEGRHASETLGTLCKKSKILKTIPKDSTLVTFDVVGLSPSIPDICGLKAI